MEKETRHIIARQVAFVLCKAFEDCFSDDISWRLRIYINC